MTGIIDLVRRFVGGTGDRQVVRECRRCGTTVGAGTEHCPRCGRAEIAQYHLP